MSELSGIKMYIEFINGFPVLRVKDDGYEVISWGLGRYEVVKEDDQERTG